MRTDLSIVAQGFYRLNYPLNHFDSIFLSESKIKIAFK
jgi:hypothetical protein